MISPLIQLRDSSRLPRQRASAATAAPASGLDTPSAASDDAPAIAALVAALDRDRVKSAPQDRNRYARTTDEHGTRPLAVVFPRVASEVQAIMRAAAEHDLGLHPISRGKNWGYGDACAPSKGQVIVDLRDMNQIVEVNERLGYAVIEPGVTQGQLSKHLEGSKLMLDVTGAGPDASIVGNALERGFGHTPYGDRFLHTCGLEVVLPDTRVLRTGFGHYDNAKAARVHRYGVGPFLDGIFSQSNLGIVTQIGIWLQPRPEAFSAFFVQAPNDADLEELIERLAPLRMNGTLRSAVHIGNDLRTISSKVRYPWERTNGETPLPPHVRAELRAELGLGAWNVCGGLYGSPAMVRASQRAVRKALSPRFTPLFLNPKRLRLLTGLQRFLARFGLGQRLGQQVDAVRPLFDVLQGRPNNAYLTGAAWRVRGSLPTSPQDPLDVNAGLTWISPVLPTTGPDARAVMNILEPIYTHYGFETQVTFTMITERALVCVSNVSFDKRNHDEAARATACTKALKHALIDAGYIPYRSGLDTRPLNRGSSVFWDVVETLKSAVDPADIVSPGRFAPSHRTGERVTTQA